MWNRRTALVDPRTQWSVQLDGSVPKNHMITRLDISAPARSKWIVEVWSGIEGVVFFLRNNTPCDSSTWHRITQPLLVQVPWMVRLTSLSDHEITVSLEWVDEHGVKHPTAEEAKGWS